MGEKKVTDLEEFLELINKPFVIKSESLGNLEFRRIFDDDFLFVNKCINENINSEYFCKQFIINQVTNPQLKLEDFNEINEEEISFILKKYIHVEDMDEYFDFDSSKNIYDIFKEGMLNYRNYVNSITKEHQLALVNSANSIISAFNFHESLSSYLSLANEAAIAAMSGASMVAEAMNQFYIPDISSHVLDMVNASAMFSATNILQILEPQLKIWHEWVALNSPVIQAIEDISLFWDRFQEDYHISSLVAQKCLKKYHWFISPNMDTYVIYDIVEVCNSSSRHKKKEINHLLINYFLDNNCEKLDMMCEIWSSNPLFEGRMKIIKDCINLLKTNNKNINYSNLIVPTLIPQIEGIQMEFMEMNGLTVDKWNNVVNSEGDIMQDNSGNNLKKEEYFRELTSDNEFLDAMNDIFLDVLFQHTRYGEDYPSIHFSRHKILHGENKKYGRKEYMVRCFMILDFLSELMFIEESN